MQAFMSHVHHKYVLYVCMYVCMYVCNSVKWSWLYRKLYTYARVGANQSLHKIVLKQYHAGNYANRKSGKTNQS